ncbi:Outer membrane porin F [Zhongshania aliphaticivorans]|uniref:Outer membrane porin F n=1 Tax=Zhongshania aliphaticivorans TaxID=1470434 RepID=A0A5S9NUR7_9GAMM|nr:OmpA family protein [Zhongshania aliphaticivorans]CAA0094377.1 Outer membrane porin F [Zhongshania aliphaticivorans]CAA0112444.1 Outer membrane porin F [Zhongshania aliphaticivorans]
MQKDTGLAISFLLVCLAGVASAPVLAEEGVYPHIYALGTMTNTDSDRNVESTNNGWQLGFGYPLTSRLYIEGLYFDNTFETGDNNGSDFYQSGGGLDLQYGFGDRERFTPFILAGVGGAQNDVVPDSLDEDSFYWNVGLGFVGRIFDLQWLRYRGEARYVQDDYLDGRSDIRFGLGLEIALGTVQEKKEVVVEKVVYKQVNVEPKDSDGDRVVDQFDECPNTLAGARVDGRGCVIEQQVINIANVTFETNSAQLTSFGKNTLASAVSFLDSQSNINIEIAGHTDNVGSDAYNLNLSQQRAASVKQYLVSSGIESYRLIAKGYGESAPIASNNTPTGRATNRRVEFRLTTR